MLLVWNVNLHLGAVHKVHHAIFGQFSILLPLSDFVTHPRTPKSTSYSSDLPILIGLIQKSRTIPPVQIISQLFAGMFGQRGLSEGLLSGRFCPGWFLSVPPSVRIHLLQQKATLNFRFHMYVKKFISVTSHALDPLSCYKMSHLLGPLPLEGDVLYGRPLICGSP